MFTLQSNNIHTNTCHVHVINEPKKNKTKKLPSLKSSSSFNKCFIFGVFHCVSVVYTKSHKLFYHLLLYLLSLNCLARLVFIFAFCLKNAQNTDVHRNTTGSIWLFNFYVVSYSKNRSKTVKKGFFFRFFFRFRR